MYICDVCVRHKTTSTRTHTRAPAANLPVDVDSDWTSSRCCCRACRSRWSLSCWTRRRRRRWRRVCSSATSWSHSTCCCPDCQSCSSSRCSRSAAQQSLIGTQQYAHVKSKNMICILVIPNHCSYYWAKSTHTCTHIPDKPGQATGISTECFAHVRVYDTTWKHSGTQRSIIIIVNYHNVSHPRRTYIFYRNSIRHYWLTSFIVL